MRKKHIFTCIALLCVLAVACVIFAACGPAEHPESGFKVTLDFKSNQCDVTITSPAEGELYDDGEEVTVTVTPKDDWILDVFSVTGYDDAALTDSTTTATGGGIYSFKVKEDTTVSVKFRAPADKVLKSLQGSIVFEGTRVKKDYLNDPKNPDESVNNLKTTFDSTNKATLIEDFHGLNPVCVWLYQATSKDAIVQISHDQNGSLYLDDPEDGKTGPEIVKKYLNPFDYLTADDLTFVGNGKWTIENEEIRLAIAQAIVGYIDAETAYFELYEDNGAIVNLKFAFARFTLLTQATDYQLLYDLNVKEHGTASIDDEYFKDYPTTEAHDELKAALQNAANAKSYIVKYENGDTVYTLYYTENGIYIDEAGNERGFAERPDGIIWSYKYDADTKQVKFDERVTDRGLEFLKAIFELTDGEEEEYYNLLKDMGDGLFSVRPETAYDSYGEVTSHFAQLFASGMDQIKDFSLNESFTFGVKIQDGKPYQAYMDIEGSAVTLTFGEWDNTTLPIQVPQTAINGNIDKSLELTWVSDDAKIQLAIDLDKMLFNGEKVEQLSSTANGYTFTYNKKEYAVSKSGDNLILSEGSTTTTLYNCAWAKYIGDFYGDYSDLHIRATSLSAKIDSGDVQNATNLKFERVEHVDDYDGYVYYTETFTFMLGGTEYTVEVYDDDQLEGFGDYLYRYKYELLTDWSDYLGTYSGEGYTVNLASDKLTITFDGNAEDVTDLTFYRDWNYNTYPPEYYYQFAFNYNEKDCFIQIIDENALLLVVDSDMFYLMDSEYKYDSSPYYGIFEGAEVYDPDTLYHVEVSADGVKIKIGDGDAKDATILYYATVIKTDYIGVESIEGYYILRIDGEIYTLQLRPYSATILTLGAYFGTTIPRIDRD